MSGCCRVREEALQFGLRNEVPELANADLTCKLALKTEETTRRTFADGREVVTKLRSQLEGYDAQISQLKYELATIDT